MAGEKRYRNDDYPTNERERDRERDRDNARTRERKAENETRDRDRQREKDRYNAESPSVIRSDPAVPPTKRAKGANTKQPSVRDEEDEPAYAVSTAQVSSRSTKKSSKKNQVSNDAEIKETAIVTAFKKLPRCNWTKGQHAGYDLSRVFFYENDPDFRSSKFAPSQGLEQLDLKLEIMFTSKGQYSGLVTDNDGNRCGWISCPEAMERIKGLDAAGHAIRCAVRWDTVSDTGTHKLWEGVFSFQAYGCSKDTPRKETGKAEPKAVYIKQEKFD